MGERGLLFGVRSYSLVKLQQKKNLSESTLINFYLTIVPDLIYYVVCAHEIYMCYPRVYVNVYSYSLQTVLKTPINNNHIILLCAEVFVFDLRKVCK